MEGVQCNQFATRWLAGSFWGMLSYWEFSFGYATDMLTHRTVSSSSQSSLGEGKPILLGLCITSTPINMTTLLMSKLLSRWGKKLTAITDLVV